MHFIYACRLTKQMQDHVIENPEIQKSVSVVFPQVIQNSPRVDSVAFYKCKLTSFGDLSVYVLTGNIYICVSALRPFSVDLTYCPYPIFMYTYPSTPNDKKLIYLAVSRITVAKNAVGRKGCGRKSNLASVHRERVI